MRELVPTRTIVRYAVALVGGFLAGNQLLAARGAWRGWHQWAISDPSLADFYRTDFWIDVGTTALVVSVAGFLFWLLGPHSRGAD